MTADRMFLDYCPLPDNVMRVRPGARSIIFPVSPDEPPELDPVFHLAPDGLPEIPCWEQVRLTPACFCYLVNGRWVWREYAWHEPTRTLALWPEREVALDTAPPPGLV